MDSELESQHSLVYPEVLLLELYLDQLGMLGVEAGGHPHPAAPPHVPEGQPLAVGSTLWHRDAVVASDGRFLVVFLHPPPSGRVLVQSAGTGISRELVAVAPQGGFPGLGRVVAPLQEAGRHHPVRPPWRR